MMSDERLVRNLRRCLSLAESAERKARTCTTEGERYHHLARADKHRHDAEQYRWQLAQRVGSTKSYAILHKIAKEVTCVY